MAQFFAQVAALPNDDQKVKMIQDLQVPNMISLLRAITDPAMVWLVSPVSYEPAKWEDQVSYLWNSLSRLYLFVAPSEQAIPINPEAKMNLLDLWRNFLCEHRKDEAELLKAACRKDLGATGLSHDVVYRAFPSLAPSHIKTAMEQQAETPSQRQGEASQSIHKSVNECNERLKEIMDKLRANEQEHAYLMELKETSTHETNEGAERTMTLSKLDILLQERDFIRQQLEEVLEWRGSSQGACSGLNPTGRARQTGSDPDARCAYGLPSFGGGLENEARRRLYEPEAVSLPRLRRREF
jgi:hypothetical protein